MFALSLAIGASVVVIMLADPMPEQSQRLLLIVRADPCQRAVAAGAQAAARERGVELAVRTLTSTGSREVTEAIASVVAEGVDGVIVAGDATGDIARQLKNLGVQNIVTAGVAAGGEKVLGHVVSGNISAGRTCAKVLQQAIPNGGNIAVLVDDVKTDPGAERLSGFLDVIRYVNRTGARLEVVEQLEDHGNPTDREDNLRSALESNSNIDFVVDLGDRAGQGDVAPLAELTRRRGAKLITFDCSEHALARVESGELYAVIAENRYLQGFESVVFLARTCRGNPLEMPVPGQGGVNVPATVVRRDNIARYRAQALSLLRPAA